MSGNNQANVSSLQRPKPPPKPKPGLLSKPTSSPTKTMPGKSIESKASLTQNVKPPRPKLPLRPPSIKKLKEAGRRKGGPIKQSSTERINDADKTREDLEQVMSGTVQNSPSSNNNAVVSENSQENFEPSLIRTMSVPVSPCAEEALDEKKRSISLIKEEDSKTTSPKPLPKPRTASKTNFEKGKPIPPPRSKLQRMKSSELPKTGSSVNSSTEKKSEGKVYPEQEKLAENVSSILPVSSEKTFLEKLRGSDAPKNDTSVTVQTEMKAEEKVTEFAPAVPAPSSDKVSLTEKSSETQEINSVRYMSTEMESKEQACLKQEVVKGCASPANLLKKKDEKTEVLEEENFDLNYPEKQAKVSESQEIIKFVSENEIGRDQIVLQSNPELKTEDTKQVKHHGYENVVISKEEKTLKNVINISPKKQVKSYENVSGPLNDSKAYQNTEISEKTEARPSKERRGYENISLNKRSDKEDRNDKDTEQTGNNNSKVIRLDLTEVRPDVSLDFKHLRIDADDYDDDYAVPIHDSQMTDDVYSVPSPQKGNIDEISDNLYQSPKASPGGARKSLFGIVAQTESPDKTTKRILRRPAPQPPMLDKNYNVLRSKSKVAQAEPNKNKENKEKDTEINDLQTDHENIYTSPTSHPAEDHRIEYENVVGEKQQVSNDEFIDHIYKEPDSHADILPIGRKSSELSNASDFELFDPHANNEYVDPSSLPKSDELASNTVMSRNSYADTGSNRSSVAIKEIEDSEYMEMSDRTSSSSSGKQKDEKEDHRDDYVDMNEHLKTNEIAQSKDSGDEYVDMSDNSPAVSPVKEFRPISNVYLQPLTKQEKTYIVPKRPAPPPPPNRPPRKLPSVPTVSYAKDDLHLSSDSESLDGHYERIHSLRREMGLPIPELDEDYSDSETDSEDEEKSKEMTDDDKAKGKLYHIANEIQTTEKTFVDALKLVCDDFGSAVRQMLQKDPSALPKNAYAQIFSDIELIYELDKKFLQDLGERMKEWDKHLRIGDIIREYSHFLKMYTNYIRGYDKTMAVFQDVYSKMPKFAALVKEYERNPSFKNLKITSYMLKPIQRIPSYRLLLVDYLKHLPTDNEDFEDISNGLKIVTAVANQINESMKEGEKFQAMLRLQSIIINNKEIVKPGRHLLKEGVLYKLSRKEAQERMFFLLTDCLFYCENAAGHNQYKIRQELPLADMSLVVPDTIDFIKELTIISTKRSFTLVASTPEERDEWATAIRSAIDDVSKRIDTFACKLDHSDKTASPLKNPTQELGRIAPRWVPDDRATMCSICCRRFTTYNRRHHCRACGEIVCKDCSSFEAPLYYLDLEVARVCEKCYHDLYNSMMDENVTETDGGSNGEVSGTKLKRSLSAVTGKFRVVKKPKRDKKDRKTLPSKFTEVNVHEQDKNMSGYLWIIKKKKQKKRWFVLKDHVLYTYKAPSDPAANFTQPVLGYDVKVTGNFDNDDFVFQLEHKGLKEPLVYRADNRPSADKWVSLLQEASELEVK